MLGLLVSRKWTLCNQLLTIPYRLNCVNVQSSITSYGLVASARLVLFFLCDCLLLLIIVEVIMIIFNFHFLSLDHQNHFILSSNL